jgi:hypothetical protein
LYDNHWVRHNRVWPEDRSEAYVELVNAYDELQSLLVVYFD